MCLKGADFCSAGNDCHPNATCHNLKAEYACSCNKGFRGDGKVCQDINECTREGANDGHHCGQNTECINLSGSYKCECLEGFSRLDKYKCIGQYAFHYKDMFDFVSNFLGRALCLSHLFSKLRITSLSISFKKQKKYAFNF